MTTTRPEASFSADQSSEPTERGGAGSALEPRRREVECTGPGVGPFTGHEALHRGDRCLNHESGLDAWSWLAPRKRGLGARYPRLRGSC